METCRQNKCEAIGAIKDGIVCAKIEGRCSSCVVKVCRRCQRRDGNSYWPSQPSGPDK